jgi:hypothetical protein
MQGHGRHGGASTGGSNRRQKVPVLDRSSQSSACIEKSLVRGVSITAGDQNDLLHRLPIKRDRSENELLASRQGSDPHADSCRQVGHFNDRLRLVLRSPGEEIWIDLFETGRTMLPEMTFDLGAYFALNKSVRPCSEETVAAELLQLAEDCDERVGCGFRRQIVEFGSAKG